MLTCPPKFFLKKGPSSNTSVLWQKGLLAGVTSKGGSTALWVWWICWADTDKLGDVAASGFETWSTGAWPSCSCSEGSHNAQLLLFCLAGEVMLCQRWDDWGWWWCEVLCAVCRNAERGCTFLSMFWDRNSQRKLNFEALQAYLIKIFPPVIFLLPKPHGSSLLAFHHCNCCTARQVPPSARMRGALTSEPLPCGEWPQIIAKCPDSHTPHPNARELDNQDEYSWGLR